VACRQHRQRQQKVAGCDYVSKSWHTGVSGVEIVFNTAPVLKTGRHPAPPVLNTVGVELVFNTGAEHRRCRLDVGDRCRAVGVDAVLTTELG
jgi:hypothetical protein